MINKFSVEGLPAPQGSKKHVGNGRMVEASKYLPAWRKAIKTECQSLFEEPMDGALEVELWFYLPRPSSISRDYPTVMPDVDKLVRGCLDGMVKGGAIVDDSRVVDLHAYKRYSVDGWTGVEVIVQHLED
jgi:crossover junction endodeoxyribonuclease RusA